MGINWVIPDYKLNRKNKENIDKLHIVILMYIRINMIKVYIFRLFKFRGIKTQLENKTIIRCTWFSFKNENKEYNRHIAFNRGHRYLLLLLLYLYRENVRGNFFTFLFLFYDLDRVFSRSSGQRYIITGTWITFFELRKKTSLSRSHRYII